MGQGQMEIALELLKKCSINGEWLCLKNLHLVVAWLPILEKVISLSKLIMKLKYCSYFCFNSFFFSQQKQELNLLKPNEKFRLWLTTEIHTNFPTILLQCSLKITYEVQSELNCVFSFFFKYTVNLALISYFFFNQSPPGIKKNIQRAYENWTPEFISKTGLIYRAQALFVLAWFHAIVQERRNYIPQVIKFNG